MEFLNVILRGEKESANDKFTKKAYDKAADLDIPAEEIGRRKK